MKSICPTRVGMNRNILEGFAKGLLHLPHTRGDEPIRRGGGADGQPRICPTRVGMNRGQS